MIQYRTAHTCDSCGAHLPEAGTAHDPDCVASALHQILTSHPARYGYPAWECRRGWTIPLVADCLESRFDLRLEMLHLRRAMSELGYDWRHRQWLRSDTRHAC